MQSWGTALAAAGPPAHASGASSCASPASALAGACPWARRVHSTELASLGTVPLAAACRPSQHPPCLLLQERPCVWVTAVHPGAVTRAGHCATHFTFPESAEPSPVFLHWGFPPGRDCTVTLHRGSGVWLLCLPPPLWLHSQRPPGLALQRPSPCGCALPGPLEPAPIHRNTEAAQCSKEHRGVLLKVRVKVLAAKFVSRHPLREDARPLQAGPPLLCQAA